MTTIERNTKKNKEELKSFQDYYYIMPLTNQSASDIRIYAIHKEENRLVNITGYISELWGYGWNSQRLKCRYKASWGGIESALCELLERNIITSWL